MKIYVASSWRNGYQASVVHFLRALGHEAYDFKSPPEGNTGFRWSKIEKDWQEWGPREFINALDSQIAIRAFNADMDALKDCEACVLVMPSGRSAHLEAGWAKGAGKKVIIYLPFLGLGEVELMYKMADKIATSLPEIQGALENLKKEEP